MIHNQEDSVSELKKLSDEELIGRAKKFAKKYCVGEGKNFKLKNFSTIPKMNLGPEDKPLVKEALEQGVSALSTLQEILYAQDKWSLLVIIQAMDAAGKDGAIKQRHVRCQSSRMSCDFIQSPKC